MKHVYIVRAGESQYKIGVTSNIVKRIKELQTSNGNKIELVSSRLVDDSSLVERELHRQLAEKRLDGGREWFNLEPEHLIELCIALSKYTASELTQLESIKELLATHIAEGERLYKKINTILFNMNTPKYIEQDIKIMKPKPKPKVRASNDSELIRKAIEIFDLEGKASTSLLQRRLSIGYGKAARIMDRLEAENRITRLQGNKERHLL